MKLANYGGRAVVTDGQYAVYVAEASKGAFGDEPHEIFQAWGDFEAWAATVDPSDGFAIDRAALLAPSPTPRQVFAVGLNYRDHAAESGLDAPTELPPVFTKYVSSFTGPDTEVVIPDGGDVDWEIELVVVIGKQGHRINEADAWDHVAGLTVGQDISERITQLRGPAPQFGLGKSYPGFSPQGPWLVTPDEFADRDALGLGCTIDGEQMQKGSTADMIFPVPQLVAALSHNVTLYPGDVIFSGTPAGVGGGRTPKRFLKAGEVLDSWIEGIGELHQLFVAAPTVNR